MAGNWYIWRLALEIAKANAINPIHGGTDESSWKFHRFLMVYFQLMSCIVKRKPSSDWNESVKVERTTLSFENKPNCILKRNKLHAPIQKMVSHYRKDFIFLNARPKIDYRNFFFNLITTASFINIPWDPCSFVFLCNYLVIPSLVASLENWIVQVIWNNETSNSLTVVAKYFCLWRHTHIAWNSIFNKCSACIKSWIHLFSRHIRLLFC